MSLFAERIKQLQTDRKTLKKDIAASIGVSVRAYQYYETSTKEPTLSILIALADFFDVSLDYLTGRSNNPNSHKLP